MRSILRAATCCAILAVFSVSPLFAQGGYFGQNKVHYEHFKF
jgi:hypothetical protein